MAQTSNTTINLEDKLFRKRPNVQKVARASFLRKGGPRVVLLISRVFGTAPLAFESNRVRISRPLWIFGTLLNIIHGLINVYFFVDEMKSHNEAKWNTTRCMHEITYFCGILTHIAITVLGLGRMKNWIKIVERVHMVKSELGDLRHVEKIKNKKSGSVVLYLVAFISINFVQISLAVYRNVSEPLQEIVVFLGTLTIQFISWMAITATTLQFVFIFRYISSIFVSFNKKLRKLLHSIDKRNRAGGDSQDRIELITENISSQTGSPNASEPAELVLRQLNVIYSEIYDLADAMNQNHTGITISLILVSSTFGIISSLFSGFKDITTEPMRTSTFVLDSFWLCHRFLGVFWLVNPGHRIKNEFIKIKHTASKLMDKEACCSNEFVEELNKFYTKLMLMKPTFSPLGVCTLSRRLIVSIAGAAVTYMVVAVQFLTTELSSNSTNNTTHI